MALSSQPQLGRVNPDARSHSRRRKDLDAELEESEDEEEEDDEEEVVERVPSPKPVMKKKSPPKP